MDRRIRPAPSVPKAFGEKLCLAVWPFRGPPRTDAASEPRAASRRRGPSPGLRRTREASGPSMSSRLLALWLVLALVVVLLLDDAQGAKGRGGKRGRGRMRSSGSARYIFYTHPKRKEYYDNPNGAQIEKASHFDYEFFLGHKIVFICVARGVPRPRITWYKDGIEIFAHPYMQSILQISEWQLEGDRIKSKLEIDPARQMDSGNYECQADNKYAIDSRTFKADFSSLGS
ncbi:hypothetical protein HPB47_020671 [Ixodes persulcatus]|uniref:Uncharacterized protein n=1 Tax=Ixodes persulcatus TaxID=34615 RepID=A0AC60QFL2_IXOPE|nr:hypothetical protein HPB47_020671 [Ixodes persulcatus]